MQSFDKLPPINGDFAIMKKKYWEIDDKLKHQKYTYDVYVKRLEFEKNMLNKLQESMDDFV
jgi:hypothetical protein